MWVDTDGDPLVLRWDLMPGLELVVFRLGGRLDVYYVLGEKEGEWVLRTSNLAEMEMSRERWGLAFTYGTA